MHHRHAADVLSSRHRAGSRRNKRIRNVPPRASDYRSAVAYGHQLVWNPGGTVASVQRVMRPMTMMLTRCEQRWVDDVRVGVVHRHKKSPDNHIPTTLVKVSGLDAPWVMDQLARHRRQLDGRMATSGR